MSACVGLHPYGPCPPGVGCNAAPDPVGLRVAELEAENAELCSRIDALEADRAPTIRAAARYAAHAWVRAQYDGNDEQITDRLRGCLNRLVDAIRRHDEKRGEDFARDGGGS